MRAVDLEIKRLHDLNVGRDNRDVVPDLNTADGARFYIARLRPEKVAEMLAAYHRWLDILTRVHYPAMRGTGSSPAGVMNVVAPIHDSITAPLGGAKDLR